MLGDPSSQDCFCTFALGFRRNDLFRWVGSELSDRLRGGVEGNGVGYERGPFPSFFKEGVQVMANLL